MIASIHEENCLLADIQTRMLFRVSDGWRVSEKAREGPVYLNFETIDLIHCHGFLTSGESFETRLLVRGRLTSAVARLMFSEVGTT